MLALCAIALVIAITITAVCVDDEPKRLATKMGICFVIGLVMMVPACTVGAGHGTVLAFDVLFLLSGGIGLVLVGSAVIACIVSVFRMAFKRPESGNAGDASDNPATGDGQDGIASGSHDTDVIPADTPDDGRPVATEAGRGAE